MVLDLVVKKEALDESQHDSLRARNATSIPLLMSLLGLFETYIMLCCWPGKRNMGLATTWIESIMAPRIVSLEKVSMSYSPVLAPIHSTQQIIH